MKTLGIAPAAQPGILSWSPSSDWEDREHITHGPKPWDCPVRPYRGDNL